MATGAQFVSDVYPAIQYLVRRLGDGHSGFFPPAVSNAVRTGGAANPIPDVRTADGDVGYIKMDAYSGVERTAILRYSNTVHSRLLAVMPMVKCGWVVDIRGNGGGNMVPMLSALRPFLGESRLGYFISPSSKGEWSAKTSAEQLGLPRPPQALDELAKSPVAVLTGPRTASSGEIVAISFRGRARTRSFGLPTGGYSTANRMFPLPDNHMLNLTTAIDADRNGVKFGHAVPPDETVQAATSSDADPALAAATAWLRQEAKCK
jgi:C-terminal processing protease CtpA/Prc